MNPVILRGIRERLRIKHLIAAGLFSLILTSTIYFTAYLNEANGGWTYNPQTGQMVQNDPSPVKGARHAFPFLLSLQGFYLMFLGTGRVAAITAEEKESGLLDYQRMTPMNPSHKYGDIFGFAAREYYMFALTLPFLMHCIIVGNFPRERASPLLRLLFVRLLYHLTAHVIGWSYPNRGPPPGFPHRVLDFTSFFLLSDRRESPFSPS